MGLNPGYLLTSFLLYLHAEKEKLFVIFFKKKLLDFSLVKSFKIKEPIRANIGTILKVLKI